MASITYNMHDAAFLKLLLHSAKYPANSINGVLLGSEGSGSTINIVDCIPLFHAGLSLAPCLEVALAQVEVHAKKNKLSIVGYYYSDARLHTSELHAAGKRVADKLMDRTPYACAVVLNNDKLAKFLKQGETLPLELWLRSSREWKRVDVGSGPVLQTARPLPALKKQFAELFVADKHTALADFDEHLDNIDRDWLNKGLGL